MAAGRQAWYRGITESFILIHRQQAERERERERERELLKPQKPIGAILITYVSAFLILLNKNGNI